MPSSSIGWATRSLRKRGLSMALSKFPPLTAPLELGQDQLGDRLQGIEDALARRRDGRVFGDAGRVEKLSKLLDRCRAGQVALVVLHDVGQPVEVIALLDEVRAQVVKRFDV